MPKGGARVGAGRPPGTPNPGTGRPSISKRLKVGDTFYVTRQIADGGSLQGELWTVASAGRGKLTFTCNGETISFTS